MPEAAFDDTNSLLGLVETIYAAVQQPELWSTVLHEVSKAIHGESMVLIAPFPEEPLVSVSRIDPEALAAYANRYAALNPLAQPCDEMFPDGTPRYSHMALTNHEFEKTEFYNDFFHPNDMHYSIGINVPFADAPTVYLSCMRPKGKGPFEEKHGSVYEALMPHLQRALSLHQQMTRMQSRMLGIEAALDAFDHAVLGLDHEGKVVLANRKAEAIVRAGDGLQVANGRLLTPDTTQNTSLQAAICEAVHGQFIGQLTAQFATASASASMLIHRRNHSVPLQLTVAPYRSSLPGRSALAALVFIGDPAHKAPSKAALLRTLYGLSPAEARIADLLAEGLTVREIADRLSITVETIRFHTKKVLAKTGSRRQAELMRFMLTLPNVEAKPHEFA